MFTTLCESIDDPGKTQACHLVSRQHKLLRIACRDPDSPINGFHINKKKYEILPYKEHH